MTPDVPPPLSPSASAPSPGSPVATYRLQLQPEFPFEAAERAAPCLARLGVSHLHLSPVLTSVPGSAHGYDVTDHSSVREELGGERGLRKLSATARAHGLGLILDVVPNHMAVPEDMRLNRPLWEVLREGPGSPYARWFDIDWEAGAGRVLLPVLGGPLGDELPALTVAQGTLRYGGRVLPLREGTEGMPLPDLLDAQHYRLAWWRLARTDLNYRRFFTISELIGVRVEDPEVFAATHATVLRLLREGVADGLRIDHPDGLADPGGYLSRLHEETGHRWTVVEKILAKGEPLPASWPVAGTTGYDALHYIDGLFTDPRGLAELAAAYRNFTGAAPEEGGEWEATARAAARRFVQRELVADTDRLARTAVRVCERASGTALRDHSPWAVRAALCEVLVRLPVYRPYVTAGEPPGEADAAMLESAAEGARQACVSPDEARAVTLVRDLALGRHGDGADQRDFAARFAQVSSALRAKSTEDTAFYRYAALLSACEVGGEPGDPAVTPEDFHAYCALRQRDRPTGVNALSTHDTKRSGDVRAAVALLTECPERWAAFLADPQVAAATARAPDPHTAWTAWQTSFGLGEPHAAENSGERLTQWLLKSVREAGLRTTWTEQDAAYEEAVRRFAESLPQAPVRAALHELLAVLAPYVRINVLGTALLHLTMPGVPDVYQGTERTYRALTDPDNRAPVHLPDAAALEAAGAPGPRPELVQEKLRLTAVALRLRRAYPEWFLGSASYEPLYAEGEAAGHCLAFARSDQAVTAVTRLGLRLHEAGGWRDTELPLPEGTWSDLLSGRAVHGRCRVAGLFADAPVALLVRTG